VIRVHGIATTFVVWNIRVIENAGVICVRHMLSIGERGPRRERHRHIVKEAYLQPCTSKCGCMSARVSAGGLCTSKCGWYECTSKCGWCECTRARRLEDNRVSQVFTPFFFFLLLFFGRGREKERKRERERERERESTEMSKAVGAITTAKQNKSARLRKVFTY
jgi:hypothetical protein